MFAELEKLPLRVATPPAWVDSAVQNPVELLNDHAHLEKKAANNALELVSRWPGQEGQNEWAAGMSAIAQDESQHLGQVVRLLKSRGGVISRGHRNSYTTALRDLVRTGQGKEEVLDRLLVSALIECRSCERFLLLAKGCRDDELAQLYDQLWKSEMGHYQVFLDYARQVASDDVVTERWKWMLEQEGQIIIEQPVGSRLHSGW